MSILQSDIENAASCLLKAIDIYTDMGRFNMAAKHHQSIAEMYESDPNGLVSHRQISLTPYFITLDFRLKLFNTTNKLLIISRARSRPAQLTSAC